MYTAISIKVVPEQSEKVEYERERLLGIAKKLINSCMILAIKGNSPAELITELTYLPQHQ
jgi:hypothetical protein